MTALRYAADGSYAYEEAWPLVEAPWIFRADLKILDVRASRPGSKWFFIQYIIHKWIEKSNI